MSKIDEIAKKAKNMKPDQNVTEQQKANVTDRAEKPVTKCTEKLKYVDMDIITEPKLKIEYSPLPLMPNNPTNIRFKKLHPLKKPIDKLLKEGTFDDAISANDYRNLYDYLKPQSEIQKAKILDQVSKVAKIPKNAIVKDFEAFIKEQKRVLSEKIKAKQLNKYKKIFDTIEDIELPQNYAVNNQFLEFYLKEDMPPQIICKVFTIGTKILAKERAYFEIKKVENNYQKTIIAPARDLTDSKKVALLFADTGEVFDSTKANLVTKFISEYMRINEEKIDTKIGRITTGWNKDIFYLPQLSNDCVWIDNPSQLEKSFTTKGTLNNQVEMLRELGKGKAFLLSLASLSSTLYDVIDTLNLNYTIHIGGLRGDGKSLGVKTAVSLYGVPNISQYGRNWNATLSGIETYVERFKSVPSWCDELEASKSIADVITFMYAFSEGVGRARAMVKDGDVIDREVKTFKGILFSTGEKNIEEVISNMGKERNIPLGVTRRVLDLKVENLWNGIDKEKVGNLLDENHGIFISKWIEIINQDKDLIKQSFKDLHKQLGWNLEGKEKLFYLMLTVLRFLTKHKIINESIYALQVSHIKELVEKERIEMLKNKDIASAFLDHASNFIAQHANFFIDEIISSPDMPNTIYGRINNNTIAITARVFREICQQNGLVQAQVIDALTRDNLLSKSSDGTPSKTVVLYKGMRTRCYVISRDALNPPEEKDENHQQNFDIVYE